MSQLDTGTVFRSHFARTLGTVALVLAGFGSAVHAASLQEAGARPSDAQEAPAGSLTEVAERLALAGDLELSAFLVRWQELPAAVQLELALAVRELDSDRSLWILVGMLDARDAAVRAAVHAALRAETGLPLPDSHELWRGWLQSEGTWLRMRGAAVVTMLRSEDEALVVAATREIAEHRICKRAFAGELERNLGRLSLGIRSVTARALGDLGNPGSCDALRCALNDRAPAVRREAQAALRRLEAQLG